MKKILAILLVFVSVSLFSQSAIDQRNIFFKNILTEQLYSYKNMILDRTSSTSQYTVANFDINDTLVFQNLPDDINSDSLFNVAVDRFHVTIVAAELRNQIIKSEAFISCIAMDLTTEINLIDSYNRHGVVIFIFNYFVKLKAQ